MEELITKMNLHTINVEGDFIISKEQLETFAKEYHSEQLRLCGVMQWVAVKEKLPSDKTQQFLVVRNGNVETETWFYRDGKGYWWNYLGITHWAEIPQPPCA